MQLFIFERLSERYSCFLIPKLVAADWYFQAKLIIFLIKGRAWHKKEIFFSKEDLNSLGRNL